MPTSSLTLHQLRYTIRTQESLALDQHPGSALRGSVFQALLKRFCTMPQQPTCAACPLARSCPVAALVAPMRDEHPRGRDVPRPFLIEPPLIAAAREDGITFEGDRQFVFGITLVGEAAKLFPYLVLSTQIMEVEGLGRPLRANQGRRGRFTVERITSRNPFTSEETILYQTGNTRVATPSGIIDEEAVRAYAQHLSPACLRLRFLTPTRLISDSKLVHTPQPAIFIRRLAERLDVLEQTYTDNAAENGAPKVGRWRTVAEDARVEVTESDVTWIDAHSYSNRQRRSVPIGGFVGTAMFTGSFAPALLELLAWGELLHVGKDVVKGNGWYIIEP